MRTFAKLLHGIALLGCAAPVVAANEDKALDRARRAAVIDMHLHAYPADAQGPPGARVCAPYTTMPVRDPRDPPNSSSWSLL